MSNPLFEVISNSAKIKNFKNEQFEQLTKQLLFNWQILPFIASKHQQLLEKFSKTLREEISRRHVSLNVQAQLQHILLIELSSLLKKNNIEFVLLKSSALKYSLYSSHLLRAAIDMDIGVRWSDTEKARKICLDLKYSSAQWNSIKKRYYPVSPLLRSIVERKHYELGFLVRIIRPSNLPSWVTNDILIDIPNQDSWYKNSIGDLCCYILADIHHGISLETPIEQILPSSRLIDIQGIGMKIPSDFWLAFHLIFKIYWECHNNIKNGAYQILDLWLLLQNLNEAQSDELIYLLENYKMCTEAQNVLIPMYENGLKMPANLSKWLNRHRIKNNNFWNKLWDSNDIN